MQHDSYRASTPILLSTGLAVLLALSPRPAEATVFDTLSLVTNDPIAHPAALSDPSLVNPWGVSFGGSGPFWVSDNGSGLSTLYTVSPTTQAVTKAGLVVSIPGDGSVTGQVSNAGAGAGAFNGDNFLFVSEDGTISGWRGALGTMAQTLQPGSSSNVYKGAALGTVGGHTYLYAANFRAGTVDVLKGDAAAPTLAGSFIDSSLPAGYAPFGIQRIGNTLYVTYAKQDMAKHDDVPGAGNGFVDAFDLNGNLLSRIASNGTLDSPWGLAVAPTSFGAFAGDLLVGNFGDGTINAFSLTTDAFVGQLLTPNGTPVSIDGLWALTPGNGGSAGSTADLYFSSGPDGETNGVFGVLQVPEPGSVTVLASVLAMLAVLRRRA